MAGIATAAEGQVSACGLSRRGELDFQCGRPVSSAHGRSGPDGTAAVDQPNLRECRKACGGGFPRRDCLRQNAPGPRPPRRRACPYSSFHGVPMDRVRLAAVPVAAGLGRRAAAPVVRSPRRPGTIHFLCGRRGCPSGSAPLNASGKPGKAADPAMASAGRTPEAHAGQPAIPGDMPGRHQNSSSTFPGIWA